MSDLIDTTEMYLRTIYELGEEGIVAMRARIAERLGHSGPTVSQTVARMERDGLVVLTEGRQLELTEAGYEKAVRVMRKHRLAERLLTDVIGLDWEYVHDEACRWEHVMSDRVEKRLITLLDHPHYSPYGNPIPGLQELGEDRPDEPFLDGVIALPTFAARALAKAPVAAGGVAAGAAPVPAETDPTEGAEPLTAVVRRLGEPLQTDVELLARLREAEVVPGATVTVEQPEPGLLSVRTAGSDIVLDLPDDVARHIFVSSSAAPASA